LVTAAFNQTQKSTCPYTSNRDVMHAAEEFYTAHDADLQLTYYSTHKLHSFFAHWCITTGDVTHVVRNLPVVMLLHCTQKSCRISESPVSGEAAAAAVKFFSFATVSLPIAWILLTGSVINGMSGFFPDDLIVVTCSKTGQLE